MTKRKWRRIRGKISETEPVVLVTRSRKFEYSATQVRLIQWLLTDTGPRHQGVKTLIVRESRIPNVGDFVKVMVPRGVTLGLPLTYRKYGPPT